MEISLTMPADGSDGGGTDSRGDGIVSQSAHPPAHGPVGLKPLDLGKMLRPLTNRDDLLGEMLNDSRH